MAALHTAGVGTSQYRGDSLLDDDHDDGNNHDDGCTYDNVDYYITATLPDAANTKLLPDADTAMDLPSTDDSATNGDDAMDSSSDVSSSSGDQSKSLMFFFDMEISGD